jgi:hypothetical protein
MPPSLPVQVGTLAGSTPVIVDIGGGGLSTQPIVSVELLESYSTLCPPGMPTRVGFEGAEVIKGRDVPRTYPSGTILGLYAYEANVLLDLGAAELS